VTATEADTIHIALLRAINVGGTKQVGMADLRELLTHLGFGDAQALLQSGNLVFRSDARAGAQLERVLEAEAQRRVGLETDFFVRTADEWQAIIAHNPFRAEAKKDPAHLLVLFLKEAPGAKAVTALQAAITGREFVRGRGREAYITYPDGIGRSRLTSAVIERHLGTRGTARNWNTVLKVGALAEGLADDHQGKR
jgi:uncharacterized protein (DUF1697 family)